MVRPCTLHRPPFITRLPHLSTTRLGWWCRPQWWYMTRPAITAAPDTMVAARATTARRATGIIDAAGTTGVARPHRHRVAMAAAIDDNGLEVAASEGNRTLGCRRIERVGGSRKNARLALLECGQQVFVTGALGAKALRKRIA